MMLVFYLTSMFHGYPSCKKLELSLTGIRIITVSEVSSHKLSMTNTWGRIHERS